MCRDRRLYGGSCFFFERIKTIDFVRILELQSVRRIFVICWDNYIACASLRREIGDTFKRLVREEV